ncbi:hypothetical protein [Actinoplanes regularis]|uniref:hypothetical protein n=1 Tax=Actinoplanes regularis TaxID=52697 RepID=UPI0024A525EB|nr:hypothetical protein [Actinoplanes regularis]GLW35640.1 hypothetical protein Areg01_85750 [Actinoplanes regularis]
MRGKIDRRAVVVDGLEMVAGEPADFERLDASRRQAGAHAARAARLHAQLRDAQDRLARIRVILSEAGAAECVCERIATVLDDTAGR